MGPVLRSRQALSCHLLKVNLTLSKYGVRHRGCQDEDAPDVREAPSASWANTVRTGVVDEVPVIRSTQVMQATVWF